MHVLLDLVPILLFEVNALTSEGVYLRFTLALEGFLGLGSARGLADYRLRGV